MARKWIDVAALAPRLNRDANTENDWTAVIQKAVDDLIGSGPAFDPEAPVGPPLGGTLYFRPGVYWIREPIRLMRFLPVPGGRWGEHQYEPFSIELVGEAGAEGFVGHASAIKAMGKFTGGPAIIIQGGQGVRLRNLVSPGVKIRGPLVKSA